MFQVDKWRRVKCDDRSTLVFVINRKYIQNLTLVDSNRKAVACILNDKTFNIICTMTWRSRANVAIKCFKFVLSLHNNLACATSFSSVGACFGSRHGYLHHRPRDRSMDSHERCLFEVPGRHWIDFLDPKDIEKFFIFESKRWELIKIKFQSVDEKQCLRFFVQLGFRKDWSTWAMITIAYSFR